MNILSICVSHVDFLLVTVFIQIILKATLFCFESNGDVIDVIVRGTVPSRGKFSVDKVWGVAATVGHEGNFFVPAARVISSSLNYASAEVSSSVRISQVQREREDRGELSHKAHKTLQYLLPIPPYWKAWKKTVSRATEQQIESHMIHENAVQLVPVILFSKTYFLWIYIHFLGCD